MKAELKHLKEEQRSLKKRLSLINNAVNALTKVYGDSPTSELAPKKRAKRGPYKKRKAK